MRWVRLLFSWKGRINRAKFWLISLLLLFVGLLPSFLLESEWSSAGSEALALLFWLTAFVTLFMIGLAASAKRLHDRGKSAWWVLVLHVAPYVFFIWSEIIKVDSVMREPLTIVGAGLGLAALYELGIRRGTPGPNRFGPDPLQDGEAAQPAVLASGEEG